MAYAKYRFFWAAKQSDGATTQEHIEIAKKNVFAALVITDQTFEDVPEEIFCPWELEYIWDWFAELDGTRINGMGHGPITNVEISAWSEGMCLDLSPFERRCILAVDRAFLIHSHSKDKNGKREPTT